MAASIIMSQSTSGKLNYVYQYQLIHVYSNFLGIFVYIVASLFKINSNINPRPDGVWRATPPDGGGGQRAPPLRSPKLRVGSEKFKRRLIAPDKMSLSKKSWWPRGHRWRHRSGQSQKVWHFRRIRLARKTLIISANKANESACVVSLTLTSTIWSTFWPFSKSRSSEVTRSKKVKH